jgi:hypothetical protein
LKKREGVVWINREMITSPYCIGLCQDEKMFNREMDRLEVPPGQRPDWVKPGFPATSHFFEKRSSYDMCAIVCLNVKRKDDPNNVVGLIIHEAVHVWKYIREEIGELNPSSEFEAYAIQTIAQRLIVAYKTPRKKK